MIVRLGISARLPITTNGLKLRRRHFLMDSITLVTTFTQAFQSFHDYSSIPYYALIPLATFSLRTVWTLPLSILQRRRLIKQAEFRPIVSALNPILKYRLGSKVMHAQAKLKSKDTIFPDATANMKYEQIILLVAKEVRKRQKKLFRDNNIQLWKNFILPAFQIPLWIIMSVTMRNLSGWSTFDSLSNKPLDLSLYTEGLLWFQDLTLADNLHALPLLIGITAIANVEWTFKTLELARPSRKNNLRISFVDAVSNISRMSVVFLMAISLHAPAALSLYWLSSQLYSLIQNVILDLFMPVTYTPITRLDATKQKNKDAKNIIDINEN